MKHSILPRRLRLRTAGLVRNAAATKGTRIETGTWQRLVWNLKPKLARNETFDGRKYVAVPMVMITEGVHRGSQGPLLYPGEELGKTPQVWNMKPLVRNHPEKDGEGVSACTAEIISEFGFGLIMNTYFDGDHTPPRLKAEAWIDPEKANEVDKRIMEAVKNEETMELSTGLFTDNEYTPGDFNGEHYDAIARNLRPDHLAVLPDSVGSCSVADGAGFIRNSIGKAKLSEDDRDLLQAAVHNLVAQVMTKSKATKDDAESAAELQRDLNGKFSNQSHEIASLTAIQRTASAFEAGSYAAHKSAASAHRAAAMAHRKQNKGKAGIFALYHDAAGRLHEQTAAAVLPTRNELSFDQTREKLAGELNKDTDWSQPGQGCYIEEVFGDEVIFRSACHGGKLFSQGYTKGKTGVQLEGDPHEVSKVISYEPVTNEVADIIDTLVHNHGWSIRSAAILSRLLTNKVLTAKARHNLSAKSFVFPKDERYPIHDIAHGRNALSRSSGKPEEAKVKAAVYRKYPALRPTANVIAKTSSGYQVRSHGGKNLSAPNLSKHEAHKRLAEVEGFKSGKYTGNEDGRMTPGELRAWALEKLGR